MSMRLTLPRMFDPGRLLDALPKTRALGRAATGRAARAAIDRAFASRPAAERERVWHAFLRSEIVNRIVYRLHCAFPRAAALAARCIPVSERRAVLAQLDEPGPLIVAAGHFGPVFLTLLALRELSRGRRTVHVLYAERGSDRASAEQFMRDIGVHAYLDDEHCVRGLLAVMRDDPRALIVLAYDHFAGARRPLRFLDTTILVPDGLGYLADRGSARVLPLRVSLDRRGMRMRFGAPTRVDAALAPAPRRRAFVDAMFAQIEAQVRVMPERWTEWPYLPFAPEAS